MSKVYLRLIFLLFVFVCLLSGRTYAQASACPAVNAGTDVTICEGTCANLVATVQGSVASTSYTVSSIPYNPYAYNTGTGVSVGTDDVWSGLINLPFCFQFFGNTYSRVVIGSNGVISFNAAYANTSSGYVICGAIPTTCGVTPLNAILGPWHDVDPSYGGSVRYQIYGTSPCRQLAVSWNNVPMFSSSCNGNNSLNATHQIILHENTNIIDIYIKQKRVCGGWNGGDAIEGIQNATGTVAYVVPGRNYPTNWTATNDGYRFTPAGAPQYSVQWLDPSGNVVGTGTTLNVCPTTTTTYRAVVTNTTCSSPIVVSDDVTVIVNPRPTVTVNSPTICTGNVANLAASGASTYTWTGGLPNGANVTTPVLSSSTSYTVTGTSANGCTNTAVANVTVNPFPTITVNSPSICTGTRATLTASGASTYTWSGGLPNGATVTTPVLTSNASYTVTGTDAFGCSNTTVANVGVFPYPTVSVNSPTICSGFPATLTATGASTYTWSGGLPAGATTTTPNLSSNTSYTVIGTDVNGCSDTAISSISVIPSPNVTVNSPSICTGQSTTLTANGGLSYTWTGGLPPNASVTTPVLSTTTTYNVTGTGSNGCTNTVTATVTVNPLPAVAVNSPAICFGTRANLSATGASSYTWSGGLPNGANVTTPILTAPASYIVTGTDANGCVNTATSTITINASPIVNVSNPVICSGQSASITASGANTYSWSGGLPAGATTNTPVLSSTTNYTVIGTDVNGCKDTATSTVTVNPLPNVTVTSPVICNGQTATISASGANSYTWTGGLAAGANTTTPVLSSTTSYTVTGTDGNGCQNTAVSTVRVNALPNVTVNSPAICFGTTASLTAGGASTYTWSGGLPNGTNVTTPILTAPASYTVTGTDVNGCVNTATANITINASPIVSVSNPVICSGQTASITASGATTYTWSGGLPAGATTSTPVLTATTNYTVIGTDAKGCKDTATSTVTVNGLPNVTVTSPVICFGQTASITASGANSYTWTGGLPAGSTTTTPVLTSTTNYTVTGTDGNGCQNTGTSTVTVNPLPTVTVNSPAICFGTTASLTAAGASTYTWSGGLPNGANVTTPILTAPASYTVTGTDANGCVNTATSNIAINASPNVSVSNPVICYGQTASITASGASSYTWSGGLPAGATTTTPALTATTNYTVIGTDAKGCKDTAISNVTVNPLPNVSVTSPVICYNQTASITASGANSYTWSGGLPNGANVNTPVLTATTNYTVTGTDANGCQNTATSSVTVNPLPVLTVNNPTICQNETATLTVSGANTYTWTGGLPNDATVTTPVLMATTSYDVTGTDGNGCVNQTRAIVTVQPVKTTNLVQVICQGETYSVGPRTFNATGNYTVNLLTFAGCDSIVNLDLTVNPVKTTSLRQTICEGQFATIGGQNFPQTGVYTVKLQTSKSCDSTVILDLTVNPRLPVAVTTTASRNNICFGEPVTFTATPEYPGTTPQYQWYINNTPVGSNSPVFSSSTLNDRDEVMVQLTSSEMCVLINPAFSEKIPMTVYRLDYSKPYIEYCSGETPVLDLNIPQTNYVINWDNGIWQQLTRNVDEVALNNTESGVVDFTIQFGNNCVHHDSVNITVNPLPIVSASVNEDTVRYGTEVQLTGSIDNPADRFTWSPATVSNPSLLNPTAIIQGSGWFTLEALDNKGCRQKASVLVSLVDDCNEEYVFIPNAFTPNSDGLNDCFAPVDVAVHTEYKLVIFNRWGERLFEANDLSQCWDGKYKGTDVLMDTYPYVIAYRCYNGKVIEKHGILTLVR